MEKLNQQVVEEWVKSVTGEFHFTRVLDGKLNPKLYPHLRVIMHRLCDVGMVVPSGRKDGWYRPVDREVARMVLSGANPSKVLNLKWPFDLERFAKLFATNVVILFGSKNAGKTAFLLNFAKLNMLNYKIAYFVSDISVDELRLRLEKFVDTYLEDWNSIEFYEMPAHLEDVLDNFKNYIVIVDLLEIFDEFWRIGEPIKKWSDKLGDDSLLVVAIQKNPGAEWGLGGQRAIERAKMVITMDISQLTLKEAKNWQDGLTESPRGKKWTFNLVGGAKFVNIQESYDG